MTKRQKLRRTGFAADFKAEDDDFILADLDLIRDDEELPPVPLNHYKDDDEIIEADELRGQNEKSPVSDVYAAADFDDIPDEDAIDRLLIDAGFDGYDEPEPGNGKPDVQVIDDISPVDELAGFDRFVVEPLEFVDQAEQHQVPDAEELPVSGSHTSADFKDLPDTDAVDSVFINSGFDGYNELEPDDGKPELAVNKVLSPSITEALPFETGQEAIKKLINDCEVKIKKATIISYASLAFGLAALLAMAVMAAMVFSAQTKISKLSDLVTILEEDMGSIAGKNADLVIDNSDSSVERLNYKVSALPDRSEQQAQQFADASKKKITAVAAKPATVKKAIDRPEAKTMPEKQKPSEAVVKKRSVEKKPNKVHPAAWSVNVAVYKSRRFAKTKAATLVKKGVPVTVVVDNKNNITTYRLRVDGFKNKAEAASYSAKIKKTLHLDSDAVSNN